MSTFGVRFWDVVCLFSTQAYVLLAVSVALGFFTLFSWVNTDPGTVARAMIRLTAVVIFVNVVVLTVIIRKCKSRDR